MPNCAARTAADKLIETATRMDAMNLDPKILDDLARRLYEAVPTGLRDAQKDLENNFRAVLQTVLGRLDLVTREEFDVQTEVLRRTREKLESINLRLVELEDAIRPPAEKTAKTKTKTKTTGNGRK